jgi:hypothetical protein
MTINLTNPEEQAVYLYSIDKMSQERALEILNRTRQQEITPRQLDELVNHLRRDWTITI